ncbi:MAG: GNAT family N-acetyltransferase [Lentisphaeria bacterium]|jgi:predicted acetyltransferase
MIVRELQSDAELLAAQQIGVLAFNSSCDIEATAKSIAANPKPKGIYGAFDERDRLCAKLAHRPFTMNFDGHWVKLAGVAGVASLVEARGKGAVGAIFRHLLRQKRQEGWLFSALYPVANSYYRQFGYEVCNYHEQYTLPTKALLAYAKSSQCEVSLGLPDDDRTPYELIFAEFARGRNLAISRTDDMWSRRLSPDPYKDKVYRYLLRDARQCPVAYVIFTVGSVDGSRSIKVTDCAFVDAAAGRDLLGFLSTLYIQYPKLEISLPTDFDLAVAVPEAYDCSKSWRASGQCRVLDVQTVLKLMRYPTENGSFSIAVDDAFLPEVSGVFHVDFQADGSVAVEPCATDAVDIRCSQECFTQLCLGFCDLTAASLRADLAVNANHDLLQRIFVRKPRYLSERF